MFIPSIVSVDGWRRISRCVRRLRAPENTRSSRALHLVAAYDHVKFALRGHMQRACDLRRQPPLVASHSPDGTKQLLIDRKPRGSLHSAKHQPIGHARGPAPRAYRSPLEKEHSRKHGRDFQTRDAVRGRRRETAGPANTLEFFAISASPMRPLPPAALFPPAPVAPATLPDGAETGRRRVANALMFESIYRPPRPRSLKRSRIRAPFLFHYKPALRLLVTVPLSPEEATERVAEAAVRNALACSPLPEFHFHVTPSVMGSNVYIHFQPRRIWRVLVTSSFLLSLSMWIYSYAARRFHLDPLIPPYNSFFAKFSLALPICCLATLVIGVVTVIVGLQIGQHRVTCALAGDGACRSK